MTSFNGIFFRAAECFWQNLRKFSYNNRTALEVCFILLYAIEQISLIVFALMAKSVRELGFVVSIFAIIVLTTFSLHKLVMESRITLLEQEVNELQKEKLSIENLAYKVKSRYYELVGNLSEDLNTSENYQSKRGIPNEK